MTGDVLVEAVVRSYSAGPPRTAAVRLMGGLGALLAAVPVAAHVTAGSLLAGAVCLVGFTEPGDYRSAVLLGVL